MKPDSKTSRKCIVFTLRVEGDDISISTFEGEYRNLMVLLQEKVFLEGFGECGGMGRCGTCLVKISSVEGTLGLRERNEASTLGKMGSLLPGVRLACQIMVDADLENIQVELLSLENRL